ncbi:MAG TPA: TonB-dependent receptor [Blastocatellia bacterium]|nr:TonB-dependent receptor [Blastocatellia bacterium]
MRCRFRSLRRLAASALLLLFVSLTASAQFKASIQGTVTDTSGAVVSGATVTVTNLETNKTQTTTTTDDGFYRVTGLPPGRYTVTAELSGFKKAVIENVVVAAEEPRGVDLKLEAGQVSEAVTVTAGAEVAPLQTENADVTRGITRQEILRIPQVGRDPYELIRLTPGVFGDGARGNGGGSVGLPNTTGPGGSNNSIFQTENQVPISANGQRLSANNFMIDGVSVNSQTWGGAAVITPNQESVKEIQVASSTYSAEEGRNSGAQIKVVSQNGTNELHGSAFFKYDSPKLNAFNKWNGPDNAPRVRVNNMFRQFGGSLGGPVIKDKLFFFFSYEGLRNNTTNYFQAFIETPEYRQLVLNRSPNSLTAQVFKTPGIEPRIVAIIPRDCTAVPDRACRVLPGGLDIGSPFATVGQYVPFSKLTGGGLDNIPDILFALLAAPGQVHGDQYNFRFDYNLGTSDTFALSTYITHFKGLTSDPAGDSRPIGDINSNRTNPAITMTWIHTLKPTMLNEVRYNFARFGYDEIKDNPNANFGIPRIEVEGLPFDRIRFGAPRSEATPGVFAENTFNFRDILSNIVGRHAMKYGLDIRWEQSNNNLAGGARPLYSFSGLWNLANDTPIFEAINADPRTGLPADAQRYFRTRDYAGFIQDDFKFRPNLTLNIGLRYEYFTPLREKNGTMSNLQFGANGLADAKVVVVDELWKPDRNNFAPRLGFAWSPARFDNKMVWRGGFGVSFNRHPSAPFLNSRGNPPFFARYNICCGGAGDAGGEGWAPPFANGQILYALGASNSPFSFPVNPKLAQGINPATGSAAGGAVEIYGAPPEVPNPYVYTYSLEVQYDLPWHVVGSAGYQGSSSHKLLRLVNQNYLYPNNPAFFAVYFPTPDVNANYNGLNLRATKQFTQGFQIDAMYRWSKSIDTLSYEGPGFVTNQTYPQDLRQERGPSDYDVRHHFVMTGLWDLPIFRTRKDWVGKALGGWQINGIFTAHTGFPWTPLIGNCVSTPGGPALCPSRPAQYFGGALHRTDNQTFMDLGGNFPGGGKLFFDTTDPGNRPPGIGRNVFRGPRYRNIDLSLVKRTGLPSLHALGENAALELRANFFNAFNLLNLSPFGFFSPSTDVNNVNFGRATSALAGRVIELQARFSF